MSIFKDMLYSNSGCQRVEGLSCSVYQLTQCIYSIVRLAAVHTG